MYNQESLATDLFSEGFNRKFNAKWQLLYFRHLHCID